MEANFSNSHNTPARYIIQLYHPSFEEDEPVYLYSCGNNVWNITWGKEIWNAKSFISESLVEREANKCRDLVIHGAKKGWTTFGYVVTEDGQYVPRFEDIAVRVLKIKISVDEL
jgi:hypothetical protein